MSYLGIDQHILRTWDPNTGERLSEFEVGLMGHSCNRVEVTDDDRYVICAAPSDAIAVWDLSSGEFVRRLDCARERFLDSRLMSSDESRLVSIAPNGQIRIRSFVSGEIDRELNTQARQTRAIEFSPDGDYVVAVGARYNRQGELVRWHVATGQIVDSVPVHGDEGPCLAISPDGRHAFTAGATRQQNVVRMWTLPAVSAESFTPLPRLATHPGDDGNRALRFAAYSVLKVDSEEEVFDLNHDFTVEAWVQVSQYRAGREVVCGNDLFPEMRRQLRPERTAGWALTLVNNEPDAQHYRWEFSAAGETTDWIRVSSDPIAYDDSVPWPWYHLAAVRDRDRLRLYCDGRELGSAPLLEAIVPSAALITLGTSQGHENLHTFDGQIRGFHITQSAKYAAEFEPALPLDKDEHSAVLYDFLTDGNYLADRSGNDRNAILSDRWRNDEDIGALHRAAEEAIDFPLTLRYVELLEDREKDRAKWEVNPGGRCASTNRAKA